MTVTKTRPWPPPTENVILPKGVVLGRGSPPTSPPPPAQRVRMETARQKGKTDMDQEQRDDRSRIDVLAAVTDTLLKLTEHGAANRDLRRLRKQVIALASSLIDGVAPEVAPRKKAKAKKKRGWTADDGKQLPSAEKSSRRDAIPV